MAKYKYY